MDTNHQYFDWLCRTCMNELEATPQDNNTKPQQQWNSIFDRVEECGAFKIAKLLSYAIPQIKVKLNDELPKRICCKCLQQLLSVYRFQQMCVQSEQQMRQRIPDKQTDPGIPAAATESEIGTNHLSSFQSSTTEQNIEHTSIQEPLLETTELVVKPEAAETSDVEIDKLLEDCRDSQGNWSEFVKNEPIEDDDPEMEYSDDDTIQSIISVKDEVMTVEAEEQQAIETNVKKHHSRHAEDKPYKCSYCRRKFNTISNMYQHKARHEVACDICGKTMVKCHLKRHKLTHSNEKTHKCDFCGKRFNRISNLRNHIRTHTGEKPYKCKYCERSFNVPSHRIIHMRVHLGDNIYRCKLCPLAFPLDKELRAHLTEHDNDDSEARERNMKALKEAEAKLQLKLSETETQQPSKEPGNERAYRFMHGEDKPYGCPYCPRTFNNKPKMFRHKSIHKGVKREACDICGKSVLKKSLKTHKLIHSKEKAHKCDICEMGFVRIESLRRHMRKHTGEKPYKCKYCERSFCHSGHRIDHMRVHLGDNIYRCELCPLAFPLAKELRAHLTEHDNDESETRERNMKALKEAEAKLQLKLSENETQQPSKEFLKPLEDETDPLEHYLKCLEEDTQISNSTFVDCTEISSQSNTTIQPLQGCRKRGANDSFEIISDVVIASPSDTAQNTAPLVEIKQTKAAKSGEKFSDPAVVLPTVSTQNNAENTIRMNHAVRKRRIKKESDVNENASALIEASQNLTNAFCAASNNEKGNSFGTYIGEEIAKLDPDLQLTARKDMHNILICLQMEQLKRNA